MANEVTYIPIQKRKDWLLDRAETLSKIIAALIKSSNEPAENIIELVDELKGLLEEVSVWEA